MSIIEINTLNINPRPAQVIFKQQQSSMPSNLAVFKDSGGAIAFSTLEAIAGSKINSADNGSLEPQLSNATSFLPIGLPSQVYQPIYNCCCYYSTAFTTFNPDMRNQRIL